MFCEHCGVLVIKDMTFCQNCGVKIVDAYNENPSIDSKQDVGSIFYSKDWRKAQLLTFSSYSYFDLLVDDEYFYLIKIPKYHASAWGTLIGLLLFNIIGAAIGSSIGSSSDSKKRESYRFKWVDANNQISSKAYDENLYLKIPINKLRESMVIEKNKISISYNGNIIRIKKYKKEFEKFVKYINQYVL